MKILICGATGYVGSRLTNKLLSEGHEVRCLARNPSSIKERFFSEKLTSVFSERFIKNIERTNKAKNIEKILIYLINLMIF